MGRIKMVLELLKNEYVKKFIFSASVIIFAGIVFHIAMPKEIEVRINNQITDAIPINIFDPVRVEFGPYEFADISKGFSDVSDSLDDIGKSLSSLQMHFDTN